MLYFFIYIVQCVLTFKNKFIVNTGKAKTRMSLRVRKIVKKGLHPNLSYKLRFVYIFSVNANIFVCIVHNFFF